MNVIYLKLYDDIFSDSLNRDLYIRRTLVFADIIVLCAVQDWFRKNILINKLNKPIFDTYVGCPSNVVVKKLLDARAKFEWFL